MPEKPVKKKRKAAAKPAAGGKKKTSAARKKPRGDSKSARSAKYGKRFLDEMTRELLLMRDRLIREVSVSARRETDHLKFDVGDFYDKASDDRERVLSLTFSERERGKLNQIEGALKRIKDGTYGICEMTGEKISEDRLRVMPFARFSLEAQEEVEKSGSG